MISSKTSNNIYKFISIVFLVFISISSYCLYYNFSIPIWDNNDGFPSDVPSHFNSALINDGYSLAHICMKIVNKMGFVQFLLPLMFVAVILVTVLFTYIFIRVVIKDKIIFNKWKTLLISCTFIFICNIYIPFFWEHLYDPISFCSQPWHNSTYLFMRMFSIVAVFSFIILYKNRYSKISMRWWIIFTVAMLLTNFSKPNFCLSFIPAIATFILIELIISKLKLWKFCIRLLLSIIISSMVMVIPFFLVYKTGSDSHIGITLFRVREYFLNPSIIWSLFSNFLFPVLVSILLFVCRIWKKDNDECNILLMFWIMVAISMFENALLGDIGPRLDHGNYTWGSFVCLFILFLYCYCELCIYKKPIYRIKLGVQIYWATQVIYFLYVLCGFSYYWYLLNGGIWMV